MADEADNAQKESDFALKVAIDAARINNEVRLPGKGSCYFCREPLPDKELFCDHDCADDYERDKRNRIKI